MNKQYEDAVKQLEDLSGINVEYFEADLSVLNTHYSILWKLTGGDLCKTALIENLNVEQCFDWLYLTKVKELNEMKQRIEEWKKIKK